VAIVLGAAIEVRNLSSSGRGLVRSKWRLSWVTEDGNGMNGAFNLDSAWLRSSSGAPED
jgi:hypothetical protein